MIVMIIGGNVYKRNNSLDVYTGDLCVPVSVDIKTPMVIKNVATISNLVKLSFKTFGAIIIIIIIIIIPIYIYNYRYDHVYSKYST